MLLFLGLHRRCVERWRRLHALHEHRNPALQLFHVLAAVGVDLCDSLGRLGADARLLDAGLGVLQFGFELLDVLLCLLDDLQHLRRNLRRLFAVLAVFVAEQFGRNRALDALRDFVGTWPVHRRDNLVAGNVHELRPGLAKRNHRIRGFLPACRVAGACGYGHVVFADRQIVQHRANRARLLVDFRLFKRLIDRRMRNLLVIAENADDALRVVNPRDHVHEAAPCMAHRARQVVREVEVCDVALALLLALLNAACGRTAGAERRIENAGC